jgi:hypothetical protein
MLKRPNRRIRDPNIRWCGRREVVRPPPIPILHADNFWRDFDVYKCKGVIFVREPVEESYGTVAVFQDLYGNLWDLLQLKH